MSSTKKQKIDSLVTGIELKDLEVIELDFKKHKNPEKKGVKLWFTYEGIEGSYKTKGKLLTVTQKYNFQAYEELTGEGKKGSYRDIFNLNAIFELKFESEYQMNDAMYEIFKEKNISIICLPYLRELVDSCLVRSGLPAIHFPFKLS